MTSKSPPDVRNHDYPSTYLPWIVADVTRVARRSYRRQDTRFFQVVKGGNVTFIRDVVQHLVRKAKYEELQWIFGGNRWQNDHQGQSSGGDRRCQKLMLVGNWLLFFVVFVLYVISIPVFYLWHVVLHNGYLAYRREVSKDADLPLVFALLSEEKEMTELFLDMGSSIEHHDSCGNNVYHYLADISIGDPEKAIRCHRILCQCIGDITVLHKVLAEQENHLGLTGFEAIAKYGSLRFYRTISHEESCIGRPLLTVSKHELWLDTHQKSFHLVQNHRTADAADRDVNQNPIHINILEFDVSKYEQGDFLGRQSYPLQLISSRNVDAMAEEDVTAVLQSKLLGRWTAIKYREYGPHCVLGHVLYAGVTVLLLFYIAHQDGYPYPYQLLPNFLKEYRDAVSDAINSTLNRGHQNVYVESFDSLYYEVDNLTSCLDTQVYVAGDEGEPFNGCQVDASKKIHSQCTPLNMTQVLYSIFIMDPDQDAYLTEMNAWILHTISIILGVTALLNTIMLLSFLCLNYNFRASTPLRALTPILSRRLPGSYTDRQLVTFMCAFFAGYIYSERQLKNIIETINQLNTHVDSIIKNRSMELMSEYSGKLDELVLQQEAKEFVCTTLLIICLLLQFLHAIHALRLLPGIGFFVITTKKMAKHLVQFAIVFVIVSLAFATIFHFVMRDKDCPALKVEGFTGLSESLFSTYQVALGQGEHEFTYNFNSKLAYTTYTVITVLLLLNLIIAVMTTTAQELNRLPWKHALCRFELWDEILGTEVTVLIIKSPLRKLISYCRRRLNLTSSLPETSSQKKFEISYVLR